MNADTNPQAYGQLPPSHPTRWLRALLFVVVGFFALGVLCIVGLLTYSWSSRSYHFQPVTLAPLHLNASLSAPWAGGVIDYHFEASYQPDHEHDVRDALQSSTDMPYQFVIHLEDAQGQILCSTTPRLVRLEPFDSGVNGVKADGSFNNCDKSKWHAAKKWGVTYEIPRGNKIVTIANAPYHPPASPLKLPYPAGTIEYTEMRGTDYLSGTVSLMQPDRTLYVPDDADLQTIRDWQLGGPVIINCQQDSCVLLNTRASGAVHVRNTR